VNSWEYIHGDNKFVDELDWKTKLRLILTNDHWIVIRRYLRCLRRQEVFQRRKGIINKILALYWRRKKNSLGNKLGFHIPAFTVGVGVSIYHHGTIIINGDAKLGENCTLHGMNCIGNDGNTKSAPIIGNGVDIGVGATIIGNVQLANNIKVGANAVVNRSCLEQGATLVGVPAHKVKKDRMESRL